MTGKRMTRLAASLAVGAILAGTAWGQVEVEWDRTYGGDSADYCSSIIQISDGGFALAGYTMSFGAGLSDFWLIRLDANGDSLWSKTYGGASYESCLSLVQTSDGGFALLGYTSSFGGGSSSNYWLVRTNANGDSLWSRSYGFDWVDYGCSIIETADRGFAVAGMTSPEEGGECYSLFRIDSVGTILWTETYKVGGWSHCESFVQTLDGGFALTGPAAPESSSQSDFSLVKTDTNGDSLWSMTYDLGFAGLCRDLTLMADGGFAMTGCAELSADTSKGCLILVDSTGSNQNLRTYGGVYGWFESIIRTPDGGFAMAGFRNPDERDQGDFWLMRTASNGDSLWETSISGGFIDFAECVIQTADGGFLIAGSTRELNSEYDFYLVKTTPDPVSVRETSLLTPSVLLLEPAYPNPFNSTTTISYSLPKPGWTSMDVMDLNGRLVGKLSDRWRTAGSYRDVWNAAGVPAGEYLIRLQAGEETGMTRVQVVR